MWSSQSCVQHVAIYFGMFANLQNYEINEQNYEQTIRRQPGNVCKDAHVALMLT